MGQTEVGKRLCASWLFGCSMEVHNELYKIELLLEQARISISRSFHKIGIRSINVESISCHAEDAMTFNSSRLSGLSLADG